LSAAPEATGIRITVKDLGDGSGRLRRLQPGTRVLIEGPYGRFTTERRQRRRVALVAAGIGITPVRALAEELCMGPAAVPQDVTVLYRADTADQLALGRELQELSDQTGMALHLLVGPPVPGSWLPEPLSDRRADADAVAALVPNVHLHDVYVCGPPAWMDLVHHSLADAGVPKEQVHDERFTW
jgi:ferredoxin-NADP reductase